MTNSIAELLDLSDLQQVQDSFVRITGIAAVLVDTEGNAITRHSGENYAVGVKLETQEGRRQQRSLYRKLCQENRISKRPSLTTSSITGLSTGAVPVLLGSHHLASWVIGQMLIEISDTVIISQALTDTGLSEAEAARALNTLPMIDRERLEDVFAFLENMTRILIHQARGRFDLVEANTELKALAERLDSTAQMLTKLTNSADVGLYVVDFFTGEVLQGNDQFARYAGKAMEDLIGGPCWLWMEAGYESFCPDCPRTLLLDDKGEPAPPIVREKYNDRTDTWIRYAHQAIYWVDGRLAHMVTMTDITQNKKLQQRLSQYAFYDRSLRIPNGLKLSQDALEWKEQVCLICFDIVALRTVNDLYGRDAGDALIAAICQWVEGMALEGAVLYRIDGDQFAYAVHGSDPSAVYDLAGVINRRFENPWCLTIGTQRMNVYCTVSIGVVCPGRDILEGDELLNVMERTIARSAETGKIILYGEEMNLEYREQLLLEKSLELCVKEGMRGFSVYYQPIVDPATGTWCAVEALCRWQSPEFGPVQPLVFIHKAEQMGLINQIGAWVLETALRECKELGLDKRDHFLLDVNISPVQMTDDTMIPAVFSLLQKYDYPGEKLSLEITESTELNFSPQTLEAIHRLREANVLVALDDFGTGYSNFNNLKKLPVSILKTERAFLLGIENDGYLQYLFYLMVELAHAAGMTIIAEGVETEDQMRILHQNGVDRMQGYLFSRPLPKDRLAAELDKFKYPSMPSLRQPAARMNLADLAGVRQDAALTPRLYKTMGKGMLLVLSGQNERDAVSDMLDYILEEQRLSRAWLYWRDDRGEFRRLLERTAPGVPASGPHPIAQTVPASPWADLLAESGMVVATDNDTQSAAVRDALQREGAKASLIFPLYDRKSLKGYAGFDDCLYYREWTSEEVFLLYNISAAISREIQKNRRE